jgi:molybdopterin/thiamine biosynthesis adenylyltransferase
MACEGVGGKVEAAALIAEPNDERTLRLRAGPDAEVLKGCSAVLFGAGALGGHVAVTLAESGIDSLRIVDGDLLSPGNVVRHVAGHDQVGGPKVNAVEAAIRNHAPWTKVESIAPPTNPYGSLEIAQLVDNVDMVIDATGNDAFVPPVALVAEGLDKPFVSGALFRGGFIGRVQRKALDADAPITNRPDSPRYPIIPAGEPAVDLAEPDLGCSAPVNNAPPTSVIACASMIAQAAIDVLTKRFELEDEVIDVYRPLPETPFDHVGRYRRPVLKPT